MVLFFAVVTVITIVSLSYLLFSFMSQSIIDSELGKQQKAMESVNRYITDKHEAAEAEVQGLYRDAVLSQGMSYLLQHSFEEYIRYRLDQAYSNITVGTADILDVQQNRIQDDPDISNIVLYSAEKQYVYAMSQLKSPRLVHTNAARSYVPDAMTMDEVAVTVPNVWVRQAIDESNPRLYAVKSSIQDPQSMRNIGSLLVYYYSDGIQKALSSYEADMKGYILVATPEGDVIFDSSNTYYGRKYPYMERINTLYATQDMEQPSYVTTLTQHQGGYVVIGVAPVEDVATAYEGLRKTILLISVLGITLATVLPALFVMNFAKRTQRIIKFMRRAENGDLTARLPDTKKDELGQISRGFNDMLEELTRYIERSYKAEIKQKHTELAALQARINPHFLYNTLEVIRMRAIAQGAADVGEMIYSLAVLFKSYVKPKPNFTLKDELENNRLYLELFRIRYKDKFAYAFDCPPELLTEPVLRMLLQPVIENYVVHGLRSDRMDNRVDVLVHREGDELILQVRDNGKGIEDVQLARLQEELDDASDEQGSFGLRSVHERLRLTYGEPYGVTLDSIAGQGTTVTLRMPASSSAEGGETDDV